MEYIREHDREQVAERISPLEFNLQWEESLKRVTEGTGQWFLEHKKFIQWRDEIGKILWCPGIPGAGKTVLASIVIHHLKSYFSEDNIATVFTFCKYNAQSKQTASALISSLLKQLIQHRLPKSKKACLLWKTCLSSKIPLLDADIQEALKSELETYSRVFIVVDGLDECEDTDGTRARFLDTLFSLPSCVTLMITARPGIQAIEEQFCKATRLDIQAQENDLAKFVNTCLLERFRLSAIIQNVPGLSKTIVETVSKHVEGMFLLAGLILDELETKTTATGVRHALKTLPRSADEYYQKIWQKITMRQDDGAKLAAQIFSWVTYACEPLSLEQLQTALSIKPGMTCLTPEDMPPKEIITSLCAGLIAVAENKSCTVVSFVRIF
ncbi:hypothetical protein M422DRAFT_783749 [Sphaerobolus stellatus SS14]|uniref:NACHT domain-containing protein n=1 Tax=Sphaerobolus stellatus (strain SS14) TaxID=990650 RepID=A0A0C9TNG0_SPHS4|nr:hypothetical protein M422DRAFT_783749 [Sphaerobolus stellatus SS14]